MQHDVVDIVSLSNVSVVTIGVFLLQSNDARVLHDVVVVVVVAVSVVFVVPLHKAVMFVFEVRPKILHPRVESKK